MLRQPAFAGSHKMLKGALHSHTTRSDGKLPPDEAIRKYAAAGYDFVALTDHRIYNHQNFAPDSDVIIVPGVENDRGIYGNGGNHCFHTVCVGPAVESGNGYGQDHSFESGKVADQFEYQRVLDEYHANGNMTIYCHPEWSGTPAREFERLSGNFAMEIWNSGCVMENEQDANAAYWDELLAQNNRIYGVATDDGHHPEHFCLGWVMVNAAPALDAILDALGSGAFYSSSGPEIRDFYIGGDGVAVVECSPCAAIGFHHLRLPTPLKTAPDGGLISRAESKVPDFCGYLRVSVRDAAGRRAWTNPIFIDA